MVAMIRSLVALALVSSLGCSHAEPQAPQAVIARVDDIAIHPAEIRAQMRPATARIGAAPARDPRSEALERAIRVHLFAREAQRLGLPGGGGPPAIVQSRLVRALITSEFEERGLRLESVTAEEVEREYEQHPGRFNATEHVRVAAIVVSDAELAERLLQEAARADDSRFRELVQEHSVHAPSRARDGELPLFDAHDTLSSDAEVGQLAFAFSAAGQVGGPARAEDGSYYILRALEVVTENDELDEAKHRFVRNALLHVRQEAALDALYDRLRAATRVVIHEEALAAISPPA